jgi:hypothetical protein
LADENENDRLLLPEVTKADGLPVGVECGEVFERMFGHVRRIAK